MVFFKVQRLETNVLLEAFEYRCISNCHHTRPEIRLQYSQTNPFSSLTAFQIPAYAKQERHKLSLF